MSRTRPQVCVTPEDPEVAGLLALMLLVTEALRHGQVGEYQVQASIAALHDRAGRHSDADWSEIASLYGLLERMTANPIVPARRPG